MADEREESASAEETQIAKVQERILNRVAEVKAKTEVAPSGLPELPPLPLVALTPIELSQAQTALGNWCDLKIKRLKIELRDARQNLTSAKENKWRTGPFQNIVNRLQPRIVFYQKVRSAVAAGYLVIPNFPIESFAVRRCTNEGYAPDGSGVERSWNMPRLEPQLLPAGEGKYANPTTTVYKQTTGKDEAGHDIERWFHHSYQQFEFPVALASPLIIQATQKALALKIFDRIGLVGPERKRDPIIVGQILRRDSYRTTALTFFIGWYLSWEML